MGGHETLSLFLLCLGVDDDKHRQYITKVFILRYSPHRIPHGLSYKHTYKRVTSLSRQPGPLFGSHQVLTPFTEAPRGSRYSSVFHSRILSPYSCRRRPPPSNVALPVALSCRLWSPHFSTLVVLPCTVTFLRVHLVHNIFLFTLLRYLLFCLSFFASYPSG